MAMRSVLRRARVNRLMDTTRGASRRFSDDKGRILSEEERAAENVYIQVNFGSGFFKPSVCFLLHFLGRDSVPEWDSVPSELNRTSSNYLALTFSCPANCGLSNHFSYWSLRRSSSEWDEIDETVVIWIRKLSAFLDDRTSRGEKWSVLSFLLSRIPSFARPLCWIACLMKGNEVIS